MGRASRRRLAHEALPVAAGLDPRAERRRSAREDRRKIAEAARIAEAAATIRVTGRPWWRRAPWWLTAKGRRLHRLERVWLDEYSKDAPRILP